MTTQNDRTLFLHILTPEALPCRDGLLKLTIPLPGDLKPSRKGAVTLLADATPLLYEISNDGFLTVTLPKSAIEDIDTVICLSLNGF